MKTYLLEHNGEIFSLGLKVNNRGYYQEEIEKINKACEITDKCFSHILTYIKKGMTK